MSGCYVLRTSIQNFDIRYVTLDKGKPTVTARIFDATRFSRYEDAEDAALYFESLPIEHQPTALRMGILRYEP